MGEFEQRTIEEFLEASNHVPTVNNVKKNKTCKKCKKSYPATIDYFYSRDDYKDGLMSECKECVRERVKMYNRKHKERKNAYDRNYYQRNKDKRNKQIYQYAQKRNKKLKHRIGVRYDQLHRIMKKKVPKPEYCIICNERKKLQVCCIDHEYSLNIKNWIWLCHPCHKVFDFCRKNMKKVHGSEVSSTKHGG